MHSFSLVLMLKEMSESKRNKKYTFLPSRIHNLSRKLLVLVLDNLTESILNGWVIALNKVTIDKLHCERRFTC